MRKLLLIVILLLVYPFLTGKAAGQHKTKLQNSSIIRHTETEGKSYKVAATVKKIYREEKKITLKHGKIKGYMPAMTMTYPVSKSSLFDGIKEGSKGMFTIFVFKGLPIITRVKLSHPKITHD